jgi:hypothetical protein
VEKDDPNTSEEAQQAATAKQVKNVYAVLCTLTDPVPLFEFVIHPTSFAQTVENLFFVSFLVKDRLAYVGFDETELEPFLVALEPTGGAAGKEREERHQWIPSINMKQWKVRLQSLFALPFLISVQTFVTWYLAKRKFALCRHLQSHTAYTGVIHRSTFHHVITKRFKRWYQ